MNEGGMLRAVKQKLPIDRQWRSCAQAFAWPIVDLVGNGIELFLAVSGEIGALGQVLPDQSVGILVGAALPRATTEKK